MTIPRTDSPAAVQSLLDAIRETESFYPLRGGMDYYQDRLSYGVEVNQRRYYIFTGREQYPESNLPAPLQARPSAMFSGSPMSNAGIKRFLEDHASIDGRQLAEDLKAYFARYAVYKHTTTPTLLSYWVMAGYLYMVFPVFPYLWINSASRGSGKTRVEELIANVSFRGLPIQSNPTEAVLFRSLDAEAGVLVLDEFENATDERRQAQIGVLNAGFNRGATVSRCHGDDHERRLFQTYGPKVFASLGDIPETLKSRSIKLVMVPKGPQKIERFSTIRLDSILQDFRDRLCIWALDNAPAVEALTRSENEHNLGIPDSLDDRARDFMLPLFAVACVVGDELSELTEFCQLLTSERATDLSESDTIRVICALSEYLGDKPEGRIPLRNLSILDPSVPALQDPGRAGHLLRALGLTIKQMRTEGVENSNKGVLFTRAELNKLMSRYNIVPAQAA